MKAKRLLSVSMVVAAMGGLASLAADVGTTFTYQGFLENGIGPVTDTCDFRFGLWDAPAGGNQKGASPQTVNLVAVENGVFTTPIDFGPGATDGTARWLAIEVQCPSDAGLTMLTPRVELTPAPYSIRAGEGVGGPNALNVTPSGDVGIGTATPATKLHVSIEGSDGVFVEGNGTGDARYSLENGGGPHFIFDDQFDAHALKIESAATRALAFSTSGPNERMRIDPAGNVGIGKTTPTARLDVNGAARATTLEIIGGSPLEQSLFGWGNNTYGQINVPAGIFIAVTAGDAHNLAIRGDGTLAGWGSNSSGQINVPADTFLTVAAGGSHSLAIRSNGTLAGWGWNGYGQIDVPSGTFTAVAAGFSHSLAIRDDGTLVGWGENNYGQINVPGGTFTGVAAGDYHSLALRSDGTLVGWGYNAQGQTNVPSGTFTAVAAGDSHSLAIRSDGTLAAWGYDSAGQINVPTGTFTAVAGGNTHSLAIRTDGSLVGWGNNDYDLSSVPTGAFTAIAAGAIHSLAIRSDPDGGAALVLHNNSAYKPGSDRWTISSDRRLKKNIEPLSGALEHLLQLRGVTFQWLDPASQGGITGTQMGLIADEVSRAFPQWVGRDLQGYQTLTVGGFEALTAEALRELRSEKDCEIEDLKSEITDLKEMVKALTARQNGGGR